MQSKMQALSKEIGQTESEIEGSKEEKEGIQRQIDLVGGEKYVHLREEYEAAKQETERMDDKMQEGKA